MTKLCSLILAYPHAVSVLITLALLGLSVAVIPSWRNWLKMNVTVLWTFVDEALRAMRNPDLVAYRLASESLEGIELARFGKSDQYIRKHLRLDPALLLENRREIVAEVNGLLASLSDRTIAKLAAHYASDGQVTVESLTAFFRQEREDAKANRCDVMEHVWRRRRLRLAA